MVNSFRNKTAQVLISVLLLLMVVALLVISITVTVVRNSRQVQNSLEYERSYNYAEARIIEYARLLSSPELDLQSIGCTQEVGGGYICEFDEIQGERRTLLNVEGVNYLEDYSLGSEEYFDLVLSSSFSGVIHMSWTGNTAFDFELVYKQGSAYRSDHEIVDPLGLYDKAITSEKGFLQSRPSVDSNSLTINFTDLKPRFTNPDVELHILRIKTINKDSGTNVTVRPDVDTPGFPDQIRRVEALNYNVNDNASAAPVVVAQFPLSPQIPVTLTNVSTFGSVVGNVCGDGILAGSEVCDDGNRNNKDDCTNKCEKNINCKPIRFESIPGTANREGAVVSDQFRDEFGVRFVNGPHVTADGDYRGACERRYPYLVKTGFPVKAFYPADTLKEEYQSSIGDWFITDTGAVNNRVPCSLNIYYDYAPASIRFQILDIDSQEKWTVRAYSSRNEVVYQRSTATGGSDGRPTTIIVPAQSEEIRRLEIVPAQPSNFPYGLAFDNFVATCE